MALKQLFKPKNQTAIRGRSSALIVTIVLHVVLFVASGVMIAVTIERKEEAAFKAQTITRPKMELKKLQVPVKIEQQAKKQPKIRPQSVSAAGVNTKKVDFVMPELSGTGSGIGVDLSGISLGGSLGLRTTQINLFGLKSKGETFLFVVDTSNNILTDEVGGIPAYKIIKAELTGLIGRLPPTALFNVAVYDQNGCQAFSKDMCTATEETVNKLKAWLAPLNTDKSRYGRSTLGTSGSFFSFEPMPPVPNTQSGWIQALTYAVKKNVDNMYWLGTDDEVDWIHKEFLDAAKNGEPLSDPNGRYPHGVDVKNYPGGAEKWRKVVAKAQALYDKENAARLARGEPVRAKQSSGNDVSLVKMMLPTEQVPLQEDQTLGKERYHYTAKDIVNYIEALQKKYKEQDLRMALAKLKMKRLRINVINFVPKTMEGVSKGLDFELTVMKDLASKTSGSYVKIQGLDAIRSAATEDSEVIVE